MHPGAPVPPPCASSGLPGAPAAGTIDPEASGSGRRGDAPLVRGYRRGSRETALAIAGNPQLLRGAVSSLDEHAYAATTRGPRASRAGLWQDIVAAAGFHPLDLTVDSFRAGVAALRAAGFRTAMAIADQAVADARERGVAVGPALSRAIAKARRACKRGLGPPRHTAAFPVERIPELPAGPEPWVPGGPAHPRRLLTVGAWWLTREIEIGNAAVDDVRLSDDGVATLALPASKTDIQALGAARSHACACGAWKPGPALLSRELCPACALRDQVRWASLGPGPAGDGPRPLFPEAAGDFPAKDGVVATIAFAAAALDLPLTEPSGAQRWGGHALRRGGAQYLGRSGVEVWRIQALARHSSSAILGYLGDSHISSLNTLASEAAAGRSLAAVRAELAALQREVAAGRLPPGDLGSALAPSPGTREATFAVATSPEDCRRGPPGRPPAAGFVLSRRPLGRLHRAHRSVAGLTACGWAWERAGEALLVPDRTGAPACARCFPAAAPATSAGAPASSCSSTGSSSDSG